MPQSGRTRRSPERFDIMARGRTTTPERCARLPEPVALPRTVAACAWGYGVAGMGLPGCGEASGPRSAAAASAWSCDVS